MFQLQRCYVSSFGISIVTRFSKSSWLRQGILNVSSCSEKKCKESENNLKKETGDVSKKKLPKTKQTVAKTSCRLDDCASPKQRGSIRIGIIGGGMVPTYTAMLLKQVSIIKSIHLVDTKNTLSGAVLDASHIDTSVRLKYFGKKYLMEALRDVDIIALMDETDFDMGKVGPSSQFVVTSSYVRRTAEQIVQACPAALIAIFAHPVTSTLAMVSEIYKCAGLWDPDKIIGSIAIDAMRMEAMTAQLLDLNPTYLSVPIVGGADCCTVVPLLSQARPVNEFTSVQEDTLIHRLRASDRELASTKIKGPKLSAGAAAAKLIITLAGGLCGFKNVITSAFVRSNVLPLCRFFATELEFGPGGVQKNFGLPKVSKKELSLIEQAIPIINEQIDVAVNVVHSEKEAKIKF